MTYALIQNGSVAKYPYSVYDARKDNPTVSFPTVANDEFMAVYGALPVTSVPQPTTDYYTQNCVEATPALVDGAWTQVWDVSDATPEETLQRKQGANDAVTQQRLEAYTVESDPIYFESQRGEATFAEWEAKVEEIRQRYPYPFPDLVEL